jgi:two-component system response regulator
MVRAVIIDDNYADFEFIRIVCEDLPFATDLIHFSSGQALFRAMEEEAALSDISFFLIDLRNPMMDGRDLLKYLKSRPAARYIPRIIISGTRKDSDISECLDLGANAFVHKPTDHEEYEACIKSIFIFWSICNLVVRDVA